MSSKKASSISSNCSSPISESGKNVSTWSSLSSKFQDLKIKTKNKQIELSNFARAKSSELAVYANQHGQILSEKSKNLISKIKKENEPLPQIPPEDNRERHVFGVSLDHVMEFSGHEYGIPLIIYQCINELTYAIDEVGLYRIPGSTHAVEILKNKYDFLEPVDLTEENPNTVATLLKLFLRELPEKLIDDDKIRRINEIIANVTTENYQSFDDFDGIIKIIEELGDWEYNLLGYICFHLKSVAENSDINKMNINNLSLIFCPTMRITPLLFLILVMHSQIIFRRFQANEEENGYTNEPENIDYENINDANENYDVKDDQENQENNYEIENQDYVDDNNNELYEAINQDYYSNENNNGINNSTNQDLLDGNNSPYNAFDNDYTYGNTNTKEMYDKDIYNVVDQNVNNNTNNNDGIEYNNSIYANNNNYDHPNTDNPIINHLDHQDVNYQTSSEEFADFENNQHLIELNDQIMGKSNSNLSQENLINIDLNDNSVGKDSSSRNYTHNEIENNDNIKNLLDIDFYSNNSNNNNSNNNNSSENTIAK